MSALENAIAWVKSVVPGVTISSGYRTVKHNEDVGGAANSYHTRGTGQAIDMVPPKGMSMSGLYNNVNAGLSAIGIKPIELFNEGDHVHLAFGQDQTFGTGSATTAGGQTDWVGGFLDNLGQLTGSPALAGATEVSKWFMNDDQKKALGMKDSLVQDWLVRGAVIAVALLLLAAGIFLIAKGPATAIIEKVAP